MKKYLLAVFLIFCVFDNVECQVNHKYFVGGGFNYFVRFNSESTVTSSLYFVKPTLGMRISEKLQVGLAFGFEGSEVLHAGNFTSERGELFISPFVRLRKQVGEGFGIYAELGVRLGAGNALSDINDVEVDEDFTTVRVYLGPGLDYALSERWIILGSWGVAQYNNSSSDYISLDSSSLSLNWNMTAVEFGVNFLF